MTRDAVDFTLTMQPDKEPSEPAIGHVEWIADPQQMEWNEWTVFALSLEIKKYRNI